MNAEQVVEKEVVAVEGQDTPTAPVIPTREEVKAMGWTAEEMDKAEKRGLIQKSEPEKKAAEPSKEPTPEAAKAESAAPEVPETKKATVKSSLPDMKFTPDEEKVITDTFGAGHPLRAFYFRTKNERQNRQAAESREREKDAKIAALEAQLKTAPPVAQEGAEDPDDAPLTAKKLREIQQRDEEAKLAAQREQNERAQTVASATEAQEEFAKSIYPDFDEAVGRAKELISNLDALVPEKWKQTKALKLIRDLQVAAANADKFGIEEYNAAMIAYEIGQLHPEYGKPKSGEPTKTGTSKEVPKADGGQDPERLKRIQDNTQRRGSSAAVPSGGGSRTVAPEEMDISTYLRLSPDQRLRFREKHPEQYAKLRRG